MFFMKVEVLLLDLIIFLGVINRVRRHLGFDEPRWGKNY